MQDLIDYRAYFGLNDFPILPVSAFWGNLTAMLGSTSPLPDSIYQDASKVAAVRIAAAAQKRATDAATAGTPLTSEQIAQYAEKEEAALVTVLSLGPRTPDCCPQSFAKAETTLARGCY